MASSDDDHDTVAKLEKPRHIKYWLRCLKTLLPHQYTGNDSNRMYLGYFILSALDLLDAIEPNTTPDERKDYIDWIYRCQHPQGGFRMWPGTCFGERATPENAPWDPAHVPGTYFALASLLILGDDLRRVKRRETLLWLRRMQRSEDGSFGETIVNGKIEGGRDPRFGFCIAGIRFILRGKASAGPLSVGEDTIDDINVEAFVSCVRAAESYDGGIADEAFHEPHAGYTYCSLGAMALLNTINSATQPSSRTQQPSSAPQNPQAVARWLANRQTDIIDPNLLANFDGATHPTLPAETTKSPSTSSSQKQQDALAEPLHQTPSSTILPQPFATQPFSTTACAGINGRTGKLADTCYAFWVSASLHLLHSAHLLHTPALTTYLLRETQHPVLGGFGKFPGDLPDLYHSYMGLAALSLAGETTLKPLDAGMCISRDVRDRLPAIWRAWGLETS